MTLQWIPTVHRYKDIAGNKVLAYEVETKCAECQRLSITCARVKNKIAGACYSCSAQRKHCSLALRVRPTKFALSLDEDSQSLPEPTLLPRVSSTEFALSLDKNPQVSLKSTNLGEDGNLTKVAPRPRPKVLCDAMTMLNTNQSKTNRFRVVSARPYPSTKSDPSPVGPSGVKRTLFDTVRTTIKQEHKGPILSSRVQIKKERESNVQRTAKKQCNISRWTSRAPISLIEAEDGNFTLQT